MHPATMLTVGAFSRASGLPVSALRYYDAAGVLRPTHVDPTTGYRRYAHDQVDQARLVARLRRTGMPVADICLVVSADPVTARRIVDAHQHHLESELAAATTHLADVRALLGAATSLTVDAGELRGVLRSVRHAVGRDPGLPALRGVLFDVDSTELRLVATDRHRLAVAGLSVTDVEGPPVRVIVPVALVDAVLDGARHGPLAMSLSADEVMLDDLRTMPVDAVYPDYRALLTTMGLPPSTTRGVPVRASDLLDQLARAADEPGVDGRPDLLLIGVAPGEVRVGGAPGPVAFDRQYLADAVRSFGDADLLLTVGERDALRLAAAHDPDAVVLLMPVRLSAHAA